MFGNNDVPFINSITDRHPPINLPVVFLLPCNISYPLLGEYFLSIFLFSISQGKYSLDHSLEGDILPIISLLNNVFLIEDIV